MRMKEVVFAGVVLLAVSTLAVADPNPAGGTITGKVTYKGQPVPKGTITFVAAAKDGRNATGAIDPNGNYRLQTENPGDGALIGDYKVTIYAHDEPVLDYIPRKPVKPKLLTPTKYEKVETSDLKGTVEGGPNNFDFNLTD